MGPAGRCVRYVSGATARVLRGSSHPSHASPSGPCSGGDALRRVRTGQRSISSKEASVSGSVYTAPSGPRASIGNGPVSLRPSWTWSVVELMRVSPVGSRAMRAPLVRSSPVVGVLGPRPPLGMMMAQRRVASAPPAPQCQRLPSGPPSPQPLFIARLKAMAGVRGANETWGVSHLPFRRRDAGRMGARRPDIDDNTRLRSPCGHHNPFGADSDTSCPSRGNLDAWSSPFRPA
jgi:hypothetical protein